MTRTVVLSTLLLISAGCGETESESTKTEPAAASGESAPLPAALKTLTVSSSAFAEGARIPDVHTCTGDDTSPPLEWTSVPEEAASLALVCDDPDAPGGKWIHWIAYDLDPNLTSLPASVPQEEQTAAGWKQGTNDFPSLGYQGPCPPPGPEHRYRFRVVALDKRLDLAPGATAEELYAAMDGAVLAWGELVGHFSRPR